VHPGSEPPDELRGGPAVLVPVKSFRSAKERLAPVMDARDRADLARQMADRVLAATRPFPVAVVCDDREVASWAEQAGALVVWAPGRGLNNAVAEGVSHLEGLGASEIVVAHSDLPLAKSFGMVVGFDGVTLVPDRREDGTNVACVPARCGFRFSYGPGSFARHEEEAGRLGLALRVLRDPDLSLDVDVPADLAACSPHAR